MLNNEMIIKIKSIVEKAKSKYDIKTIKCELNNFNNVILTIICKQRNFVFTVFEDGNTISGATGKDFKEMEINNILV
ncbi:hypothetical protein EJM73_09170 [Clostridium botulinum]|uniref:hypothetical protein n=1 Tax=Clostridium botulinum TaxID=1491 RepID=UPI001376498F|nr:hypothetical protein [Clostridium botulinum]NCI19796.1 hypothetical protein [Clostridium botulinum]NCI35834.1 hypothetical protein [Clostridium botulinum]NCI71691.1 hypothetical protein [Clostridium botulinum]NDI38883.1 hypothetical protein [Clostridium botulinum]